MTIDEWFADTKNPMAEVMQAVRATLPEDADVAAKADALQDVVGAYILQHS